MRLAAMACRKRPFAGKAVAAPLERMDYAYSAGTAMGSQWAAHYVIYRESSKHASRLVPTLDICCGSGPGTRFLHDVLDAPVLGVDYSEEAIRYARANNSADGIEFALLDVRSEALRLCRLVKDRCIRQAFCIEGIEHIPNHTEVIDALFGAGIEKILVSTPMEKEGASPLDWHVNPITPTKMAAMGDRYALRVHAYCRLVDWAQSAGRDPSSYVTECAEEGLNYIFGLEPRTRHG